MTSLGGRTERLFHDLTATERGLMVLQAWKRGEREDPKVRSTIRERADVLAFNHLISVMNAANTRMGLYVIELAHAVDLLGMELQWLQALDMWSDDVTWLGTFILFHGRTMITESEHQALIDADRAQWTPLQALAEEMVEDFDDWTPEELEVNADGEEVVRDVAWKRRVAQFERQLRQLVRDGTLKGRTTKGGISVEVGSFYDWRGRAPVVFPDWGPPFEVRPDEESEDVRRTQVLIEHVRTILQTTPRTLLTRRIEKRTEAEQNALPFDAGKEAWDRMLTVKAEQAGRRWREIGAVEVVFAEVGDREFAGEAPELPYVRATMDAATAKLEASRKVLGAMGKEFEFEQPTEGDLKAAREMYADVLARES